MRILLFETDEQRRARWHETLGHTSATTVAVGTREDALSAVVASRFELAFVDIRRMTHPSRDFAEFMERLKSRCGDVVCIVDHDNTTQIEFAYASGFDDCMLDDASDQEIRTKIERAQSWQQLNQQLAQAQKLGSIGELASGIAHEINTPIQYVGDNTRFVKSACDDLMQVLGSIQTLVDADGTACDELASKIRSIMEEADIAYLLEEVPSAVTQTLEGTDRITKIVRAMKDFAHPGVSEMSLVDLSVAIQNTIMVATSEWKHVAEIETVFDPELEPVQCFQGELNQVFLNMIVNAAHAISESLGESAETKGKITIETRHAPPNAEIRISDTGTGIASENVDRVFAPFFTTKPAGKGTGQGLAIAHSVAVEKHNGTVQVESEFGNGTTFVIRLPLLNDQLDTCNTQQQPAFSPETSAC